MIKLPAWFPQASQMTAGFPWGRTVLPAQLHLPRPQQKKALYKWWPSKASEVIWIEFIELNKARRHCANAEQWREPHHMSSLLAITQCGKPIWPCKTPSSSLFLHSSLIDRFLKARTIHNVLETTQSKTHPLSHSQKRPLHWKLPRSQQSAPQATAHHKPESQADWGLSEIIMNLQMHACVCVNRRSCCHGVTA